MESRDPERIPEVLHSIGVVWRRHPELRLSQLVLNYLGPDVRCPELYGLEDDELLRRLGVANPPLVRKPVVDLSSVESEEEIHSIFATELKFPEFYGNNWDAFWDVLVGFDCFPKRFVILGRAHLESRFPISLTQMERCFEESEVQFPSQSPSVEWR